MDSYGCILVFQERSIVLSDNNKKWKFYKFQSIYLKQFFFFSFFKSLECENEQKVSRNEQSRVIAFFSNFFASKRGRGRHVLVLYFPFLRDGWTTGGQRGNKFVNTMDGTITAFNTTLSTIQRDLPRVTTVTKFLGQYTMTVLVDEG